MEHIAITAGWVLFCWLHSFLAEVNIKKKISVLLKLDPFQYRIGYNLFAFASLSIILYLHSRIDSYSFYFGFIIKTMLAPICIIVGISIMVYCFIKYFRQHSGLNKEKGVLIISGLHAFVRHPLYSGTFIFLVGLFLIMPCLTNLIAVMIIISYTVLALPSEEKKLVDQFGQQYILYRKKVPALIPKIF